MFERVVVAVDKFAFAQSRKGNTPGSRDSSVFCRHFRRLGARDKEVEVRFERVSRRVPDDCYAHGADAICEGETVQRRNRHAWHSRSFSKRVPRRGRIAKSPYHPTQS
ncbi:MAG: hypothetical protein DWI10_10615 [Planctomycetota bacterium]|nr:MAG: hypothetical protein DWI10_10615 [Planctomycetota bacterium]